MFAYRSHVLFLSLILVIAILMSDTEYAHSAVFQYRLKRQAENDARKYCGSSLSGTLRMLCGSVYNPRFKKNTPEMEMDYYALGNDMHPYRSIENARKMLRFRRNSLGIHQECCVKSCSTQELRSYCGSR